jgi:hypothetical protein
MLTGFRCAVPCSGMGLYAGVEGLCVAGTSVVALGLVAVGIVALAASVSRKDGLEHMVLTGSDWRWR